MYEMHPIVLDQSVFQICKDRSKGSPWRLHVAPIIFYSRFSIPLTQHEPGDFIHYRIDWPSENRTKTRINGGVSSHQPERSDPKSQACKSVPWLPLSEQRSDLVSGFIRCSRTVEEGDGGAFESRRYVLFLNTQGGTWVLTGLQCSTSNLGKWLILENSMIAGLARLSMLGKVLDCTVCLILNTLCSDKHERENWWGN